MGLSFSAVSLAAFLLVVFVTRRHIKDSRNASIEGNTVGAFIKDMREIVTDRLARYILLFTIIVWTGIAFGSTLQMYLYEHFMRFTGIKKTIVPRGSMAGFGLGSLAASWLTSRFEKRGGVVWGAVQTIGANAILSILFLPGMLVPGQHATVFSLDIPISFVVFAALHMLYWTGNGIIFPTTLSMMADVSEINEIRTGINKDGSYAAVFSFAQKVSISLAVLGSGYILEFIGFITGKEIVQSASTLWLLCAWTLLAGPAIAVVSLWLIRGYPVTNAVLTRIRGEGADAEAAIHRALDCPLHVRYHIWWM
jgi:Na+/melibiose symporter-like transporter